MERMELRPPPSEIVGLVPWPYDRQVPTYMRHDGTYFATPAGTTVVAPAGGRVATVAADLVRIDHGDGLCTALGHLASSLVDVGADVARGEPIGVSGTAHVHLAVWLDGALVDPFAREGEVSLWVTGNMPQPNDELFDDSLDIDLDTEIVDAHPRVPRLDLPFSAADFDGVVFPDA
jgi:murein DD-endopeptidase MepM/ murein hydrolase activator NlpD